MDKQKNIFKLKADINTLINYGFKKISDTEFVYRVPLYKYMNRVLIQGIFTADVDENTISIEVIDNNTGTLYFPYYNADYGKNDVKKIVDRKMSTEINKMSKSNII